MNTIRIHTLWVTRRSVNGYPELVAVGDETAVRDDPRGWQQHCRKELNLIGDDVAASREIILHVLVRDIEHAFAHPVVTTTVDR